MIEQLKDLKDTYESVRNQIDRGKEPLEELLKLSNFLKSLNQDPSILKSKVDQDYRRYFHEDFSTGMLKRLAKERSKNDKYLETVAAIEESFVRILVEELREGNFNQQFFDSIKLVFEYDCILHNYNYQISDEELKSLRNTNQQWRQDLKEGDMVDAIVDENQNNRCSGWSQARISYINQDSLHLEFIYDSKNVDRSVDRWSVEIAPYQSKTKESWDWRSTLVADAQVDAHDKTVWNKSTILDIKEQEVDANRKIKLAFIAYRIYVESSNKSDERGQYDGWSNRFDEWITLYSPRLQPFHTKTQKGLSDDIDIDEEMDTQLKPQEGHDRVYAVPRIRKCTSSLYIHLINLFGHLGGFDLILDNLKKQDDEKLDLNILANLMSIVSSPYLVFHKEFVLEYGPQFVQHCQQRLKEAPERNLRDVRREKIEGIIKSIDLIQRRCVSKDEREKGTEILKLEVSMMCLKSSFLERRIQGVKDLNSIIRNNRMFSHKSFTPQYLIDWMTNNQVFHILFDPKQTHLQLVQRCGDILKLLLQEDRFSQELMEMFWNLAKTDYKFEVYKIINECSFQLKQQHIDFFFEQIKKVPPEKIAMEEFQCLSELGKYAKDEQFKVKVSSFFWQVICNADSYKEDLVTNCISKFCEMVKNWELEKKQEFFISLTENLKTYKSSIPTLRLFKGLLKDQKERYVSSYSSAVKEPEQSSGQEQTVELTLNGILNNLLEKHQLVKVILQNLQHYCEQVNQKYDGKPFESRKKLFILHPKYSHSDEIDERLQFIKYIASISDFKISKQELGVVYQLLVINSKISSDQEEFLTWCKSSCEQSSSITTILDLNEVGEFFTDKMQSKELDLKNLLVVGFDFLQQYFLTVNEKEQKLIKSQKQQKSKYSSISYNYQMNSYGYGPAPYNKNSYGRNNNQKADDEDDDCPIFKILVTPANLAQLDIVWNIALEAENPRVVTKAIDFLIKVYTCLDEDLNPQRIEIQDVLIEKCMVIVKESTTEFKIKRALEIIKNIIYEAEKKGTGDVQPHNALLKGELLERIVIKNKASPKRGNFVLSIFSNATVWELKKEVAKQLDLSPKYLKLQRNQGKVIQDIENGKTLAQLGFENNETLNAIKVNIEEEVANAPLIASDGKLSEKAKQIFNEIFDMYSDESGSMVKNTCARFIEGCTGEKPSVNDERITNLFKKYDSNNDGKIERHEFLVFYESASRDKPETVRENLRAHNIRNDLKKLSEIQEESSFTNIQMPRYKISKKQEYFDLLVSLLDRHDASSEASWDLIQMLATNETLYKRVLELQTAKDSETNKIEWSKFFDSQSVYKLLYTLQIIEAVMEEGEDSGCERITVQDEDKVQVKSNANVPKAPPLAPGMEDIKPPEDTDKIEKKEEPQLLNKKLSQIVSDQSEDEYLKSQWTKMFLENKGFQYILQVFMEKDIQVSSEQSQFNQAFELKHVAFLLKLLRIFIMAAFSTSTESQVYEEANLIRRSSMQEDETQNQDNFHEGSRFKELQKLLKGPMGKSIIDQINYAQLQQKILLTVAKILSKEKMIFEDKLIIENALSLWVGCLLHINNLWNDFLNFQGQDSTTIKNTSDFILTGLLYCNQDKIREEFKQSLSSLSHKLQGGETISQPPLSYLLNLLSENFGLISSYHCKQYFELFCELIDHYFATEKQQINKKEQAFNPEKLLSQIIDKIQDYNKLSQENQEDSKQQKSEEEEEQLQTEQENIYIGLLQLTEKIIENFDISFSERVVQSKNLIDEIFVNFLFSSIFAKEKNSNLDNLRIKPKKTQRKQNKKVTFGKKSKDSAYKLLNSLISKSPKLLNQFVENSMIPLIKLIKRHDGWIYSPPGSSERIQKYVGLKNLGCICYMNAMMQQFFMIPPFRYNLLCVDDQTPEDLQEYKGQKVDDNVLHQLQKLMAHLELSERSDYNPFEFCFAFKDLDGNPTNTSEQKDAQEFLNLAFDRIENMLRNTTKKHLLQSVFGGKTCSQLLCTECGKVKNRIEDYYNLSLTVKDIKSMHDSLSKLVEGEQISGYECDGCKKKVDISKRTLISSTPNVLIVHLQRIIFNFDTFRNDKINSYFEFPYQLDLKPYSFYEVMKKENRMKQKKEDDEEEEEEQEEKKQDEDEQWPEQEDCFEYKLVGVVVHSGTANAGHYWSYINTRRGYNEPDENDPNWSKTETDPWMEFNDSSVRDFNFEKLKEECFGGDGKGGSDDAWSFGGSYGKSAYMLVYERKTKKPLKILVDQEEAKTSQQQHVLHDEKSSEYYKLIDFREGVEDIAPNKIYKQVFEDNQKFEFENDIYSQEFFEFVERILGASQQIQQLQNADQEELYKAKQNCLFIGRKVTFEILCKCFHNQSISEIVEAQLRILNSDIDLTKQFLQNCFDEDDCNYVMEILLECSDTLARQHVAKLFKSIVNRLKIAEKDILYETQTVTLKDQQGQDYTATIPKALSARFILKCFSLLNTLVAKNWSKFDHFLDLLQSFALGEKESSEDLEEQKQIETNQQIGLEFFFYHKFIEKACDFLLGRKSPLCNPSDKRYEMGGSFSQPNFSPIIKLMTKMIKKQDFIEKYPLTELEQQMFLHNDLLKIMLGSPQGSKEFGQCLANMCKDNLKLSKRVSKVFIKVINNSNFENVKNYLKALKPFVKLNDSLKILKLEWIFGVGQILAKKGYKQDKFSYGLENVDKLNDECSQYLSPLLNTQTEESLLAQLIKFKGKLDTLAVNCLKEMISLMAKDDDIAKFVYNQPPITYQMSRYTDWIRPYLEGQKADIERSNSYSYLKQKHDTILVSLRLLALFEGKVEVYKKEQEEQLKKAREQEEFKIIEEQWLAYENQEVLPHFPPQLIIGKQVEEEKIIKEFEDNLVKVTLSEIVCEYNYSNPTGLFNLSLPHIDLKTSNYQTMSYQQYKTYQAERERQLAKEQQQEQQRATNNGQDIEEEEEEKSNMTAPQNAPQNDQQEEEPPVVVQVITRNWFTEKKAGSLILKVHAQSKSINKVSFRVSLKNNDSNVKLPTSFLKDILFAKDQKTLMHFIKIDPTKEWGNFEIKLETNEINLQQPSNSQSGGVPKMMNQSNYIQCYHCKKPNDPTQEYCEACGEVPQAPNEKGEDGYMESYFTRYD